MSHKDNIQRKIFTWKQLSHQLATWRFQGKKIVFTNGCFDIIHLGHIDYLSKAADLGDILIIGLNADVSVRKLKGPGRPITSEESRSWVLASFSFVSAVILFEEDTPINLIEGIKPDVLVKGGDYTAEAVVGYDTVTSHGGRVVILPFLPGYSTTTIEEKISLSGPGTGKI